MTTPTTRPRLGLSCMLISALGALIAAEVLPAGAARAVSEAPPPVEAATVVDCALPGIDDHCETWTRGFGFSSLVALRVGPNGDRVFTGWDAGSGASEEGWFPVGRIAAYDAATGDPLWEAELAGTPTKIPRPTPAPPSGTRFARPLRAPIGLVDLAVSPDGRRVYAVGEDIAAGAKTDHDADISVAAFDAATGDLLWKSVLGLPGIDENDRIESLERAGAITVSPDGRRVYVTGSTHLRDRLELDDWGRPVKVTHEDVLAAAYDAATGTRIWVTTGDKRYTLEQGMFIAVSPNGKMVYISGQTRPCDPFPQMVGDCPADFLVLAVQAADPANPSRDGEVLWESRYDGGIGGHDRLSGMDLAADGNRVFVTGTSMGEFIAELSGFRWDWATAAFDAATGKRAWASRYEGPVGRVHDALSPSRSNTPNRSMAVSASPTGEKVFVTGISTTRATISSPTATTTHFLDADSVTVAYDAATGEQDWEAYHLMFTGSSVGGRDNPGRTRDLGVGGVDVSPDGTKVYVVDQVDLVWSETRSWRTVAYDAATGGQIWVGMVPSRHFFGNWSAWVEVGSDGEVVFSAGGPNGNIQAYDAAP